MEQNENTLSVLKIAPGQHPQQVEIDNDLKALQQAVGGSIGARADSTGSSGQHPTAHRDRPCVLSGRASGRAGGKDPERCRYHLGEVSLRGSQTPESGSTFFAGE